MCSVFNSKDVAPSSVSKTVSAPEPDAKKEQRKSLGRRVSFAHNLASVREYQRNAAEWRTPPPQESDSSFNSSEAGGTPKHSADKTQAAAQDNESGLVESGDEAGALFDARAARPWDEREVDLSADGDTMTGEFSVASDHSSDFARTPAADVSDDLLYAHETLTGDMTSAINPAFDVVRGGRNGWFELNSKPRSLEFAAASPAGAASDEEDTGPIDVHGHASVRKQAKCV